MQPTDTQVRRSLDALEEPLAAADPLDPATAGVPAGLVDFLVGDPVVRYDRMADARRRLQSGKSPSDDDLANRVVGRLVCDRLR